MSTRLGEAHLSGAGVSLGTALLPPVPPPVFESKGQITLVVRVLLPPALRSSQDFALVGASPGMKVDELKRKVLTEISLAKGMSLHVLEFCMGKPVIVAVGSDKDGDPELIFSRELMSAVVPFPKTLSTAEEAMQTLVLLQCYNRRSRMAGAYVILKAIAIRVFYPPSLKGGFDTFSGDGDTLLLDLKAAAVAKRSQGLPHDPQRYQFRHKAKGTSDQPEENIDDLSLQVLFGAFRGDPSEPSTVNLELVDKGAPSTNDRFSPVPVSGTVQRATGLGLWRSFYFDFDTDTKPAVMRFFKEQKDAKPGKKPLETIPLELIVRCFFVKAPDRSDRVEICLQGKPGSQTLKCKEQGAEYVLEALGQSLLDVTVETKLPPKAVNSPETPSYVVEIASTSRRSTLILSGSGRAAEATGTDAEGQTEEASELFRRAGKGVASSSLRKRIFQIPFWSSPTAEGNKDSKLDLVEVGAERKALTSKVLPSPASAKLLEGTLEFWSEPPDYTIQEGCLSKTGAWNTAYKQRYMRLCGNKLYYYRSHRFTPKKNDRGVIVLTAESEVSPNAVDEAKFGFSLVPVKGGRRYGFLASSMAEKERWLAAIRSKCKGTDTSLVDPNEALCTWKCMTASVQNSRLQLFDKDSMSRCAVPALCLELSEVVDCKLLEGHNNHFVVSTTAGRAWYFRRPRPFRPPSTTEWISVLTSQSKARESLKVPEFATPPQLVKVKSATPQEDAPHVPAGCISVYFDDNTYTTFPAPLDATTSMVLQTVLKRRALPQSKLETHGLFLREPSPYDEDEFQDRLLGPNEHPLEIQANKVHDPYVEEHRRKLNSDCQSPETSPNKKSGREHEVKHKFVFRARGVERESTSAPVAPSPVPTREAVPPAAPQRKVVFYDPAQRSLFIGTKIECSPETPLSSFLGPTFQETKAGLTAGSLAEQGTLVLNNEKYEVVVWGKPYEPPPVTVHLAASPVASSLSSGSSVFSPSDSEGQSSLRPRAPSAFAGFGSPDLNPTSTSNSHLTSSSSSVLFSPPASTGTTMALTSANSSSALVTTVTPITKTTPLTSATPTSSVPVMSPLSNMSSGLPRLSSNLLPTSGSLLSTTSPGSLPNSRSSSPTRAKRPVRRKSGIFGSSTHLSSGLPNYAELPGGALLTLVFLCDQSSVASIPCVCKQWRKAILSFMQQFNKDSDDENGDEDAGSEIASEWGDMRDDFSRGTFDVSSDLRIDEDVEYDEGFDAEEVLKDWVGWSKGEDSVPIIIDNGMGSMKAGLSWETNPSWVTASHLATPSQDAQRAMGMEIAMCGGEFLHCACENPDILRRINSNVFQDAPKNWCDLELFWQRIVEHYELDVSTHPIFMTVPMNCPTKLLSMTQEVVLETMQATACAISESASLPFRAYNELLEGDTALVVDVGHSGTQIVAISGGSLVLGKRASHLGGAAIEAQIRLHLHNLRKQLLPVRPSGRAISPHVTDYLLTWVARDIKEKLAYCAPDHGTHYAMRVDKNQARLEAMSLPYFVPWEVADKTPISLTFEPLDAGEYLFQPSLIMNDFDESFYSLPDMIAKIIGDCPSSIRQPLANNILLSGGVTHLQQFGPRLMNSLQTQFKASPQLSGLADHVRLIAEEWRRQAVWRGARQLVNTAEFQSQWVFRQQREEYGYDRPIRPPL